MSGGTSSGSRGALTMPVALMTWVPRTVLARPPVVQRTAKPSPSRSMAVTWVSVVTASDSASR